MSTLSDRIAALEEAARKKPNKKKAAKRDENGRYGKQEITKPGDE